MKKNLVSLFVLLIVIISTNLLQGKNLFISENETSVIIQEEKQQDSFYSEKELGCFFKDGNTFFRLFTPNASKVKLCLFEKPGFKPDNEYEMERDENGVWEVKLEGNMDGMFYAYKVFHDGSENPPLCVDPYSKAVATYNDYMNPRLSIIYNEEYDWEGDTWLPRKWTDHIIYEMHVRDMTAHKSSGSSKPGTYHGLIQKGKTGGIDYIKKLGVNTVELLPSQEFGCIEIPWKDSMAGRFNTWNPYERNHWGYMTGAFFAPEAYYSEDWKELKWNTWMGTTGKQVNDFKDMVKAFHKEGIAVMMDVVYNHLSEYETGNLKEIDLEYYFRLNEDGTCMAASGCGNDLRTEAPMMRKMIVESILYWIKEYHIDGFRFDLGALIDWITIEEIIREARKINPNVVFVCEPWGGGKYDPEGFSVRDWGVWNDQVRNGIKGQNPRDGQGWIFGKWQGNNNPGRIKSYVQGTLLRDSLGLFTKKEHSVNYLAAHDDNTLGDFIRLALGKVNSEKKIKNVDRFVKLSSGELKLHKLASLFLLTSQGMTMIHSGQEFARTKVIPHNIKAEDEHKGHIDHNSYNKDNETNYINYKHAKANRELFDYYAGLIELRKTYKAFREAEYDDIKFITLKDFPFALAYELKYGDDRFFALFNAEQKADVTFDLPDGKWQVLVNEKTAGTKPLKKVSGRYKLKSVSGAVLKFLK